MSQWLVVIFLELEWREAKHYSFYGSAAVSGLLFLAIQPAANYRLLDGQKQHVIRPLFVIYQAKRLICRPYLRNQPAEITARTNLNLPVVS